MRLDSSSSARSNTTSSTHSARSSRSTGGLPAGVSRHAAHDKLKLNLTLSRRSEEAWVAGEIVTGTLELAVSSNELELGEVGVEFAGYEELRLRDHTSTRRLLSARVDFQGGSLPPSNATVQDAPQKHAGFWPALRGRTRFPFSFRLPKDAPSSCTLGGNATTRYELRAFVSSLLDENVDVRSEKTPVQVVEKWIDWDRGEWNESLERKAAERLKVGSDGYVSMAAAIGKDEWSETPLRLFWPGNADLNWHGKNQIELRARIQNLSKRHVSGLKVTLCRCLRRIYPKDVEPPRREVRVVAAIMTQQFHGVGFEFPPGEEREVHAQFLVPQQECWTKRRGTLFELDVYVRVELDSNIFANDLAVELPVFVAHPASLPPAAHGMMEQRLRRFAERPDLPHHSSFPSNAHLLQGYRDPYGMAAPYEYPDQPDVRQQWTAMSPGTGLHRTASTSTLAYASSACGPSPLPVAWTPSMSRQSSAFWPASPFVQAMPQPPHPPLPVVAPVFAAPPSATPVFAAPPAPLSPVQYARSETSSPTRRSPLPARPDSGLSQRVAQPVIGQPMPPTSPSPVPMQRSNSSSSLKSHKKSQTPPPASPSSRFSPVSAIAADSVVGVSEIGLLETIGEDGESQAGTARSVAREVTQALAVVPASPSDHTQFPSPKGRIESRNSAQDLEELVEQEDKDAEKRKKNQTDEGTMTTRSPRKSVPRAQDIFSKADEPPKSPSRGPLVRPEGGLAALEARLSRPTTPATGSPALSLAPTSAPAASSRQLPQQESVPSLSDKLSSLKMKPSSSVQQAMQRLFDEKQDVDDILDSYGFDEEDDKAEETFEHVGCAPSSPTKARPVFAQRKPVSTVVKADKPVVEVREGHTVVDKAEVKELQKEAVSRVSDWSGEDRLDEPKEVPCVCEERATTNQTASISKGVSKSPWTSAGRLKSSTKTVVEGKASPLHRHEVTKSEPLVPCANDLEFELKKSGEEDKGWEKAGKGVLRASPSGELASLRYDIRSARGGKGGVVSKVASKWTTLIDEEQREANKPPPPRIEPPKALKIASTLFEAPTATPLSPVNNLRSTQCNSMPVVATHTRSLATPTKRFSGGGALPASKSQTLLSGPLLQASPSSMMRTSVSASSISSDKGGDSVTEDAVGKRMSSSSGRNSKVKEMLAKYAQYVEAQ
ncbi:hypothetical protein OIV83_002012 [Microbotryomycetes sp. JL201]|nr:hypothetical protein OIV83_002012 [Microbotryomycetes sp. JL201]